METKFNSERGRPDFKKSVSELIDDARRLASLDKNLPDLIGLDMDKNEYLIIQFFEDEKPEDTLQKLSRKFNLEPQKTTKIEIFYSPLKLDDDKQIAITLKFVQKKWKNRESLKFVEGSTRSSEILANPHRRPPQEGLYPVYDRDTIDWAKIPQGTPINEDEAVKILQKIQGKVSSLSPVIEL